MTFVGYKPSIKTYLFMTDDNKLVQSVQCKFDEFYFPRGKLAVTQDRLYNNDLYSPPSNDSTDEGSSGSKSQEPPSFQNISNNTPPEAPVERQRHDTPPSEAVSDDREPRFFPRSSSPIRSPPPVDSRPLTPEKKEESSSSPKIRSPSNVPLSGLQSGSRSQSPQIKTEDLEDSYIPGSDRPVRLPTPGPSRPPPTRPYDHSTDPENTFLPTDPGMSQPDSRNVSRYRNPVKYIPSYDAHDTREPSQRDQPFNPQISAEGFDIINNNPIRRTTRAHKPRILDQNLYGPKTPAQIEADIQKGKDEQVVNRSY
ncbi:hypothetical protein M378DRAFT_18776 [Amanita muscaria Koide BX008]|uniref:Uncharacterized protein n=1 Tax=Amanita muscaria (strain Koide BX008) TaxID=946122 RepID=A0A0C2RWD1_AMAMK|nr:hypothetical protein M378DRAFT_18776 [Amanita muscaria Koide BX008]